MLNKNYIFFRDDDVYKLDRNFIEFFNLFLRNKIPIVYGVIPGEAEDRLVKFLSDKKKRYPTLIDIAQHGWLHKNYNPDISNNGYEFGPRRSYGEQKKDIIQGWLKLYGMLKDKFTPMFIPPNHAYDFTTLKIINELGERKNLYIFSAGKKTIPKIKKFLDIPIAISYEPSLYKDARDINVLLQNLIDKFKRASIIGILFHHENFNRKDIGILKNFLNSILRSKISNFILLSSLIKYRKICKMDLALEITNKCNLKCKICNIWREKPTRDLSIDDVKKITDSLSQAYAIGAVSLTGGEPFLNPDVKKIYRFFYEQKLNNKIKSIGIYTNGYANKMILNFLKVNSSFLRGLDMGISIDGLESSHNLLRGKTDAFKNSAGLIDRIISDYPQVKLAAKFTITAINYKDLLSIYRWCRKRRLSLIIKFIEFENRFYYHRVASPLSFHTSLSPKDSKTIKNILLRIYANELSNKNRIVDLPILKTLIDFAEKGDKIVKECYTPMYSLFITPNGNIHPCVYEPAISNIKHKMWIKKMMGKNHLEIIRKGIDNNCKKCFAYHGYLQNFNIS